MRSSFEKKRTKVITKRQEVIASDLSLSKSSLRETENGQKSQKSLGLRKALEQLQAVLLEQREKREELEGKIAKLQLRNIERENEFRKIIEQAIPFCAKERSSNVLSANLKTVYSKIVDFFEITQQALELNLTEQRKWLQQQMERKIQMITAHVEKDLQQNRRLQSLSYEAIHREISTAISLSASILEQNQTMKKRLRQCEFRLELQKEEKELLIAELLQKKTLITKMYSHLREKYNKDDEIEKEISYIRKDRRAIERLYDNYEKTIRGDLDNTYKTIESIKPQAIKIFTTQHKVPSSAKPKTLMETQGSANIKTQSPQRFYSSTIDVKASQSRHAKIRPFQRNLLSNSRDSSQKSQEGSLVYQLREDLKRQRRKNSEQGQRIEYLIGYKRDIDLFIRQCYRSKGLQDLNHAKIEKILSDLKRRMENELPVKQVKTERINFQDYQGLLQA